MKGPAVAGGFALAGLAATAAFADPVMRIEGTSETIVIEAGQLSDVVAARSYSDLPAVRFRLSQALAERFGKMTSAQIGEPIRIFVCGKLVAEPVVMDAILGGVGEISMGTDAMARDLASAMKTGDCTPIS